MGAKAGPPPLRAGGSSRPKRGGVSLAAGTPLSADRPRRRPRRWAKRPALPGTREKRAEALKASRPLKRCTVTAGGAVCSSCDVAQWLVTCDAISPLSALTMQGCGPGAGEARGLLKTFPMGGTQSRLAGPGCARGVGRARGPGKGMPGRNAEGMEAQGGGLSTRKQAGPLPVQEPRFLTGTRGHAPSWSFLRPDGLPATCHWLEAAAPPKAAPKTSPNLTSFVKALPVLL